MDEAFWLGRWERDEIGFHLPKVNPHLAHHWLSLGLRAGAKVLVPLCGKTLDMQWLCQQGYVVLGIELSEKAAEDFFSEQGLACQTEHRGAYRRYRSEEDAVQIWCGDFFALTAADVMDCSAFYDRAALVALPPEKRERYARHLSQILPRACRGLLVNLEYDQEKMAGPPFSVHESEVNNLFSADWEVQLLHRKSVLEGNPKFRQNGLANVDEGAFLLTRR